MGTCIHNDYIYTCIHVRDMKKKEASKVKQTNNKAKQHSTHKAVTFPKLGLEPTTLYTLHSTLYTLHSTLYTLGTCEFTIIISGAMCPYVSIK